MHFSGTNLAPRRKKRKGTTINNRIPDAPKFYVISMRYYATRNFGVPQETYDLFIDIEGVTGSIPVASTIPSLKIRDEPAPGP
jgi:hypothetical protein